VSDSLLNILKLLLLALVYLFFVRVLRAMWVQVTAPAVAAASGTAAADVTARAGAAPVARLRIIEPADQKGKTFDLTDEVTVGRASGCQVALADPTVSQLHARIFRREGKLYVEDLGSSNGTFVTRKKVAAPVAIRRGDRLSLGSTVLEVMR
jgi:pSer/pThr/pTyr-binding forkhead associated (FHA) protein